MVMAPSTNGTGTELFQPGLEKRSEAPSIDQILSLYTDNLSYFTPFYGQCEDAERYYYGLNAVPTPTGFDTVRPATPRAIINTATDHVDVHNLAIDVPEASPRAKARAERIKKFLQGVWLNIREPVLRTVVSQGFLYGISFLKPMFEADLWPDRPPPFEEFLSEEAYRDSLQEWLEKRSISFPLSVKNVNPRNVMWDDSRTGIKWAIEHYVRSDANYVRHRYSGWRSDKTNGQPFTWMEYWDDTWCVYVADGTVVWSGPHDYGYVPYIPIHAASTPQWDAGRPEFRFRGLLTPIRSLLDSEARLVTAYEAIIRQFAWRSLDFYGPQGAAQATSEVYDLAGGKNIVPPGVEVRGSPILSPPPELLQQLNMVQTLIEEATFPNVVRGVRPRGVSSGFALSVLAGMGRLVFQGMADGMGRAIERCNIGFLKLVENKVRGKLTVRARTEIHNFDQTISPDDIRGYYENTVTLKAEAPEERERETILAFRIWNNGEGVISLAEAQRRSGVTNPLEMQMEQSAERLLKSPLFMQAQEQIAIERLGLLNQMAQAVESVGDAPRLGNQFLPGQAQLQRPGEAGIQRQRVGTREAREASPSAFPRGLGGLDVLGQLIGTAPGGAINMPSGGTVR